MRNFKILLLRNFHLNLFSDKYSVSIFFADWSLWVFIIYYMSLSILYSHSYRNLVVSRCVNLWNTFLIIFVMTRFPEHYSYKIIVEFDIENITGLKKFLSVPRHYRPLKLIQLVPNCIKWLKNYKKKSVNKESTLQRKTPFNSKKRDKF